MTERGYALDMSSVVSHVATEMEGADPDGPAPTVESMAATYRHVITGDLARICLHEGADSDHGAVLWLVQAAVRELGAHVTADGDGYRLATPLDEIRWHGRAVARAGRDEHARLGDPFNPMAGGVFASNVRIGKAHKANPPEDDKLRESMREAGWLPGHPAVVDERGVTVAGHRRLKVAAELRAEGVDITDDVLPITFGSGDGADIARLKHAWWSNEGSKPYTPSDRQAVVAYLRERGWTQASIAEALHVAQKTISEDLRKAEQANLIIPEYNQDVLNGPSGPDSGYGGRRRGAGRPRSSKRQARQEENEQRKAETDRQAHPLFEAGLGRKDIAGRLGVGEETIKLSRERWDTLRRESGQWEAAPSGHEGDTATPAAPRMTPPPPAPDPLDQMVALFRTYAAEAQLRLVMRLLREMTAEDRAAAVSMADE